MEEKSMFDISHFKLYQFSVGNNSDVKMWESEFKSLAAI